MTSVRLERWIARKLRLRHVELIAALYECRSILKASRRLSLTQPTLTKALQDVEATLDRKSTRLNSSHLVISYAVFCLKKKHRHLHESCAVVLERTDRSLL